MKLAFVNLTRTFEDSHGLTFLYLSAYIKHYKPNVQIDFVDINYDDVTAKLIEVKPDLIGITSTSLEYPNTIRFCKKLRENSQFTFLPIIIGGVHISTMPSSFHPVFDVGVLYDGEVPLLDLVNRFEEKGDLKDISDIKSLIYLKDGKLVTTDPATQVSNINDMPLPDYSILNKEYFRVKMVNGLLRKGREATIITARGCPYKCAFCSAAAFNAKYRAYSMDNVFKIIKDLHDTYGIDVFNVMDDLFTASISRIRNLITILKEHDLLGKIKFKCECRADSFVEETAQVLKELGVVSIIFGFESGSEKSLQFLKARTTTVEQNKSAVVVATKYGFQVVANIIIGVPGEKIEDLKDTYAFFKFCQKHNCYDIPVYVLVPFPGTTVWQIAVDRGKIKPCDNWEFFDEAVFTMNNLKNPLLLDPDVPLKKFQKYYFKMVSAMKKRMLKYFFQRLIHDGPNLMLQTVKHPKRAMSVIKDLLT